MRQRSWLKGLPCFYCSADSFEMKLFLITILGSLFVATVCIFMAGHMKGKFKELEKTKHQVLEAEEGVSDGP